MKHIVIKGVAFRVGDEVVLTLLNVIYILTIENIGHQYMEFKNILFEYDYKNDMAILEQYNNKYKTKRLITNDGFKLMDYRNGPTEE